MNFWASVATPFLQKSKLQKFFPKKLLVKSMKYILYNYIISRKRCLIRTNRLPAIFQFIKTVFSPIIVSLNLAPNFSGATFFDYLQ